ncbi:MAG: heavy metal-associated domain-containing protein [Candidatus Pacearchaeota archaeon]
MKKIKLTIQGMHCASCASNIERSLKKIRGIKNASVSLMLKKGTVEADDKVSDDDIRKAVERAGYKVISIEKE